jgi:hypothetical protein
VLSESEVFPNIRSRLEKAIPELQGLRVVTIWRFRHLRSGGFPGFFESS